MVLLTIKEKDILWEKRAIAERQISLQSHLAPETEGSHELWHSKNCGPQESFISGTHFPSWVSSFFSTQPIGWDSGNVQMIWAPALPPWPLESTEALCHIRICLLPSLSILSPGLRLLPTLHLYLLILLDDHCFVSFTTLLDLCGPKPSVYLSSLHGIFFGVGHLFLYSLAIFLSLYHGRKTGLVNNPVLILSQLYVAGFLIDGWPLLVQVVTTPS